MADDPTSNPSPEHEELELRRRAVGQALQTHRAQVDDVLASGDAAAIKQLYVDLGDLLQAGAQGMSEAVPVLSFPETGPVVAAIAGRMTGRILDAGCGPNPVVSILLGRRPQATIVGVDIGLGTVRLARAHADSVGVRLLPVVGDLEALPFRDSVFDGSVCEDTIEHLPDDRAGVRELARVIRPGGQLVLATPNRRRLDVLVERWRDRRRGERRPPSAYFAATSHLREYTWRDLERVVEPAFRVLQRAAVGWTGGWRARLANQLVRRWPGRDVSRVLVLELEPRKTG